MGAEIEVRDLHKSLGGRKVLDGLTFEVKRGETVTLIGGSGSGKTVILKHLVGLLRPDRGTVRVAGVDLGGAGPGELERVRRKIGYLFQGAALLQSLTVFDNIALPLRERGGRSEKEIRAEVRRRLERVGLAEAAAKYPDQLSGGMRKRAGLARVLDDEKEIFLFDEPTAGLDPQGAAAIRDLLLSLCRRENVTCVVVAHDIPFVLAVSERVALLRDGKIYAHGAPVQMSESDDPVVRQFLTGEPGAAA